MVKTIDEQAQMIDEDFQRSFNQRVQTIVESTRAMHAATEELGAQDLATRIRAAHYLSLNIAKSQYSAFIETNELPQ